MHRFLGALQIRPGEGRLAAGVMSVMILTLAGYGLGSAGLEALFFTRFGVQWLPPLYMALAALNLLTSLGVTAWLGQTSGPRAAVYIGLPLISALVLAGARAAFWLDAPGLYPALWLGKEVINLLLGLATWGLAGAVCDPRQAKRLFPLFGASRILGGVLGSLSTGPLVTGLGTENLLLVWAGALAAAALTARALMARPVLSGRRRPAPRRPARLRDELQAGYQTVRRSPLMRWIAVAAVLFSILYFSIALPFSKTAAAQFPDERSLAGFLGLFNGVSTAAAFLASVLLANRLYVRFGLMAMLLAFPALYLAGFGALALAASFQLVVAFRFVQMVWLAGVADAAYQALFNTVPADRRDQARAFISGVPEQAGTFLAGAILFVGEQAFEPRYLYGVGLAAAALTVLVVWRAGRAYAGALLDALRAGQPAPFWGAAPTAGHFPMDAAATALVIAALRDPQASLRRIAAEILGQLPAAGQAALAGLVGALRDAEPEVRAAALRALAQLHTAPAMLDITGRLADPEPEVRLQAVETVRALAGFPDGLRAHLEPLLADPEPAVRVRAAAALLKAGPHAAARDLLRRLAALGELEERVQALNALADWGDAEAFALIEAELADTYAPAASRRAAARALAVCGVAAAAPLAAALGDRDQGVRAAAIEALAHLGPPVLDHVVAALADPAAETAALQALERLPVEPAAGAVRRYINQRFTAAIHYDLLWRDVAPQAAEARTQLLAEVLRAAAHGQAVNAWRAASLLADHALITTALEGLQSPDAGQRATALEALETVPSLADLRPLLRLWDHPDPRLTVVPLEQHLIDLLDTEADAWLRAAAALAATGRPEPAMHAALERRAAADPDPLVRATAQCALGTPMNTLATVSIMERLLFLRRVPLFTGLTPADLRQVATLAGEQVFPADQLIAKQGEPGEVMYIIVAGEVRVVVDGREIARRQRGDIVGEMALLSQEPRHADLIAAGEVRVLSLDQASFESLLRDRPDVSLAVMRVLCARLREANR